MEEPENREEPGNEVAGRQVIGTALMIGSPPLVAAAFGVALAVAPDGPGPLVVAFPFLGPLAALGCGAGAALRVDCRGLPAQQAAVRRQAAAVIAGFVGLGAYFILGVLTFVLVSAYSTLTHPR